MNDLIVRALSVSAGGKRASSPLAVPISASSKFGRKGERYGSADFDILEEGGDTETIELHANQPMPTPSVAVRQRVNIRRKKLD